LDSDDDDDDDDDVDDINSLIPDYNNNNLKNYKYV